MINALYKRHAIITAVILAALFIPFVRSDILKKVPGFFHCESFGCMGLGLAYAIIAFFLIPVCFVIAGFIFGGKHKLRAAGFSLLISWLAMGASFAVLNQLNQMQIVADTLAGEAAEKELQERLAHP